MRDIKKSAVIYRGDKKGDDFKVVFLSHLNKPSRKELSDRPSIAMDSDMQHRELSAHLVSSSQS